MDAVTTYWSENKRELWIRVLPQAVRDGQLSIEQLLEACKAHETRCQFLPGGLQELSEIDWKTLSAPLERMIAVQVPSAIQVEIAPDAMAAWLTVFPAPGEQWDKQSLLSVLHDQGVKFGILDAVLDEAISTGQLERTIVAQGQPAQKGQDAWFEYLVDEASQQPQQNQDGSVDFHELNRLTLVSVDQPLMRKHPATEGHPGTTVTGIMVCGADGQDKPLLAGTGSGICPDDWNVLVATKSGKPICSSQSVRVDDLLELDEIGVATGNVHFKGSVVVQGNVGNGYTLEASGDIEIMGLVEGATVESGSNIRIHHGVVGQNTAKLVAKGHIEARFIENAEIECTGNLQVVDHISHCEVRVAGQVLVGLDHGRGQINGGHICATQLVKARIIGSPSSTQTTIAVGVSPYFAERLKHMEQELYSSKNRLEETLKSIIYLRTKAQSQPDTLSSLEQQREWLLKRVMVLKEDLTHLRRQLVDYVTMAKVVGADHIYPGVKLSLMEHHRQITEDLAGSCFVVKQEHGSPSIYLAPVMQGDRQFERCA